MMLRLRTSCAIQLHDWMETSTGYILVLEHPEGCKTLHCYLENSLSVDKVTALQFMRQLLNAARHCFSHGVFHRDLHLTNVLVTEPSADLKVIDFGCALAFDNESLDSRKYHGNAIICPPEIKDHDAFLAGPAYVWCPGAIFKEIIKACETNAYRSTIRRCLSHDPADRPTLDELESRLR
ncbi:hypothetical protein DNTS_006501 [Danionella cerebrum]|uniref:non-specific serine/threonine protein kinase n=1 Tax=Danionella cerebrum TaxID=2873325 RepID=A0A553QUB3_9TELE|nr:hypothetical protein DNTS_006501 [Danionella translucida]